MTQVAIGGSQEVGGGRKVWRKEREREELRKVRPEWGAAGLRTALAPGPGIRAGLGIVGTEDRRKHPERRRHVGKGVE